MLKAILLAGCQSDIPIQDVDLVANDNELIFQAGKNGNGVSLFRGVNEANHPTTSFGVYINGELTSQTYNNLFFSKGDVVKIVAEDVSSFPIFDASEAKCVRDVAKLPLMTDKDGVAVALLGGIFEENGLVRIPEDLFANNPEITLLQDCFAHTKITEIPENLLANNLALTNCWRMFSYTNITTIPANLFASVPNAELESCFECCQKLTSIPEGLFSGNVATKAAGNGFSSGEYHGYTNGFFRGCESLVSIPEDLFLNTAIRNFSGCFRECKSLATIPEGLFKNGGSRFETTFESCTNLTTIPKGLFSNNTLTDSFYACFEKCTSLKTIPDGLFSNNSIVNDFGFCFFGCTNLTTVPESLFEQNVSVTSFKMTFFDCSKLSGRIKIGSTKVTDATDFCTGAGAITVVVPAGSTTETTFRLVAETLTNLTVETY